MRLSELPGMNSKSKKYRSFAPAVLVLLFVAGCSRQTPRQKEIEAVENLADLPGLTRSHDRLLKSELARLVSERATPALLSERDSGSANSSDCIREMDTSLNNVLAPREVQLLLGRLQKAQPEGPLTFGPLRSRQVADLHHRFLETLRQYRKVLLRPGFAFHVNWRRGLLADLTFIEHAQLAHRLEALAANEALSQGRPSEAVLPLRNMFQIDQNLARIGHAVARLEAAKLRRHALYVTQAVVQHRRATRTVYRECLRVVAKQLSNWPNDEDAWIGDRAVGLHTYELVRAGDVLSVLMPKEIEAMTQAGELEAFVAATIQFVDSDERTYLATMREVIASCKQPYYQRRQTLSDIVRRVEQLRDTPRYPLFAAKVLFPGIESGHRIQASDRARIEAWTLALATALGDSRPDLKVNPMTGKPYEVTSTYREVLVQRFLGPDQSEAIHVPRRAQTAASPASKLMP